MAFDFIKKAFKFQSTPPAEGCDRLFIIGKLK